MKKGMIKVSVFYGNAEGKTFDVDYYCNKHMPMVQETLGDALKGFSIDKGLAGGNPGEPAPYLAMGHLYFETIEAFQNSFGPNADKFMADVPNYTNADLTVQISAVEI